MKALDEILIEYFGAKPPVFNKKGQLTASGQRAYDKLDMDLLQQQINEGYVMLSDGRYLPPKEVVEQCYNAFGARVGLLDDWEKIYDEWV